jgi:hypothetical protein
MRKEGLANLGYPEASRWLIRLHSVFSSTNLSGSPSMNASGRHSAQEGLTCNPESFVQRLAPLIHGWKKGPEPFANAFNTPLVGISFFAGGFFGYLMATGLSPLLGAVTFAVLSVTFWCIFFRKAQRRLAEWHEGYSESQEEALVELERRMDSGKSLDRLFSE